MALNVETHEPKPILGAAPFVWVDPQTIPRRQWLYRPHYIRGFLTLTLAAGGTSKSTLTMTEALAMVTGRSLLGVKPKEKLRVWYFNLEDPQDELDRRTAAICKKFSITKEEIADRLFINSGRKTPLIIARDDFREGAKVDEHVVARIREEIAANKIDVMIVDPFVASHLVPENDNSKMNVVAHTWAEIAEVTNCSIHMVHHTRKTGGQAATAEDGRGAKALVDAARSVRNLNTMTKEEAKAAGLDEDESGYYFRADGGKMNLTPPAESADWFQRSSVDLENIEGVDWDQGDRVGVVVSFDYPRIGVPTVTAIELQRVLAKVDDGTWRANAQSKKSWVGVAVADVLDLDIDDTPTRKGVKKLITLWLENKVLVVVRRKDDHREPRPFVARGPNAVPRPGAADKGEP